MNFRTIPSGKQNGYIALTSAIILLAVILVIVLTLSLNSFLNRLNVSSAHLKEKSYALARACAEEALLKLSQNSAYGGGETIMVASDTCSIVSVTASSSQKIVLTQSQFQNAFTDLRITVNASSLAIVGWEELPHF